MEISQIVFCGFATLIVVSALCVVLLRNVIHCALFLGLCFAGVAGIFASLGADFLFAAQILIYVSAVAVLILFVVLLSGRVEDMLSRQINEQWLPALILCALTATGLASVIRQTNFINASGTATLGNSPLRSVLEATTAPLGKILLTDLAVPFEAVSLVLLAALVGAIIFSRPEGAPSPPPTLPSAGRSGKIFYLPTPTRGEGE